MLQVDVSFGGDSIQLLRDLDRTENIDTGGGWKGEMLVL